MPGSTAGVVDYHNSYYGSGSPSPRVRSSMPSPPSSPSPADLGQLPQTMPSPSPSDSNPSPAPLREVTTTTQEFVQPSSVTTTTATTATTTTTTSVPLDCIQTVSGVPCEDRGRCTVDPVSGYPFCWTSSLDWVRGHILRKLLSSSVH